MHPHLAIQVASAPSPSTHVSESCLAALGKTVGKAAHPTKVATGLQPCSTRRICAGFFSVLAVVAITLNFFRICYGLRGQGNLSRRLAGREPPEKEDPVLSAILDMCLDMEEEVSGCPQTLAVRPERGWGDASAMAAAASVSGRAAGKPSGRVCAASGMGSLSAAFS